MVPDAAGWFCSFAVSVWPALWAMTSLVHVPGICAVGEREREREGG